MTRRMYRWTALIATVVAIVAAEVSVGQAPSPPPITPTAEQQQLVQAAVEAETTAARDLQVAQANYRAAQAKTLQVIYQVMAEQKLSPAEYTWTGQNGKLVFVKLPEKKEGKP